MKNSCICLFFLLLLVPNHALLAQDISLFTQHNGRYDFVFFGNTMNLAENNLLGPCVVLTESAAGLNLAAGNTIQKAYLYWAGSGTGDFNVRLNGTEINAEREFNLVHWATNLSYFNAFADVTSLVQQSGNGIYTLSDLDVSAFLIPEQYCNNRTNFAGWGIVVIYENAALPLNQLNIYDGLKGVPMLIDIVLENLNVIDNDDAKIGFIAWEGDSTLEINETLSINGNALSNLPLNPINNAFNSTNSFTGATDLYNMDLDVYSIENNISIGDDTAHIQLTSGAIQPNGQLAGDFVMIGTVVTKLNSQLPDATIRIDELITECNSQTLLAHFTVSNTNSTDALPAGVPIAIYLNGVFLEYTETLIPIPIGESISDLVTLFLPDGTQSPFTLEFRVDDNGTSQGIVTELNEVNNSFSGTFSQRPLPGFMDALPVLACNEGLGRGTFDFSGLSGTIAENPSDLVTFYESLEDAEMGINAIANTHSFVAQTPKTIFVRIQGECYNTTSFELRVRNCPPTVYNYISVNNDGKNDSFFIEGLRDIFVNFKLEVYNRWGVLIWTGNNQTPNWDGIATRGILVDDNAMPDGTYYYVLDLNDPDYSEPLTGFLYLKH